MADEQTGGTPPAGTIDLGAIMAERDKLRDELAGARTRIKELNGESAGHRLNAERLGKLADERATAVETAKAEALVALDAARKESAGALDALRTDLTGKLTAAEQAAVEREQAARERVMRADLRLAAKDAGMVDLDGLKLLDPVALKVADDGTVTNAAEAMSALKQAKPWAFGQVSTSTGAQPPPADVGKAKRFEDMSAVEQTEWKRSNGLR